MFPADILYSEVSILSDTDLLHLGFSLYILVPVSVLEPLFNHTEVTS